jgi:glycosyltransferase involved in cell wall biosynthesis
MGQRIHFTIEDLGLTKRVHLMGRVSPPEVLAHVQGADAFVLASLSEGISNAALEAMSCGLPVVSTNCGGMNEAISDGVEGFLVPPREPSAMVEALLKLARDPALRQRMGQAGRTRVLKDFTLQDQIASFSNLFESLIEPVKTQQTL